MSELDLSDPLIREMADRNHTPKEMWSLAGKLIAVACEACNQSYPCETRKQLWQLGEQ